ncbi:MAG: hypothetical protein M3319_05935, partial [Actinomycetota bacterium]|nr:hypothetical protein [Actinomycetota bacterium]
MGKKLMVVVALLATLVVLGGTAMAATVTPLDPIATYTPLGGTAGHQTFPIAATVAAWDCSDITVSPAPGQTVWHFVLTQPGASSGNLRAEFVPHSPNGGVTVPDVADTPKPSGVLHWYVVTSNGLSLTNVSSDVTGGNLNLSHFCVNPAAADSHTSTEIHKSADDSDGTAVVNGSLPLGSTVHDKATITTDNNVAIPAGSTAKFSFYRGTDCGGDLIASSLDLDATSGSVDPALPQGPLHAGGYGYKAVFTSGDTTKVKNSTGDCEPLTIDRAQLSVATKIHDVSHQVVGDTVHVSLGSVVHDTAKVDGGIDGFAVPAVQFKLDGNDVPTSADLDSDYDIRSVDSAPLAAGSYTYSASVPDSVDYIGATSAPEPLTVDRGKLTLTTEIHNAATESVIANDGHVALGTKTHDTAQLSGAVDGFPAPSTDGIVFKLNGVDAGRTDGTGADAIGSQDSVALAAGDYKYVATLAGNTNYEDATSADEPFHVDQARLAITTTIHNSSHAAVTQVLVNSVVHDTATVTGQVAGFDIGPISFTLDGNPAANGAAEAGVTARSVDSGPMTLGDHTYQAKVEGNGNYIGATSELEPLKVIKPTAWCSPGFWKNASDAAWLKTGLG